MLNHQTHRTVQLFQSLSDDSLELDDEEEEDDLCFLFFCPFFFSCFPCSCLFFLLFFLWLFSFFFFLLSSSSEEEDDLLPFFFFFLVSSSLEDEADLFLDFLSLLFFRFCLFFLSVSSWEPLRCWPLRLCFSLCWTAGTSSSLSSLLVLLTSRTISFWGSTLTKFRHSKVKCPAERKGRTDDKKKCYCWSYKIMINLKHIHFLCGFIYTSF